MSELPAAFLGVKSSVTGRRWVRRVDQAELVAGSPEQIERQGAGIASRLGISPLLGFLAALRGVKTDEAAAFFAPRLRDCLPDPSSFLDMDKAAARIATAIKSSETIAIFGDYDVDGATSAALLGRFFRTLGTTPLIYIPDRILEGYGPNLIAFDRLQSLGATLIITVDCGTTAHSALSYAQNQGLDVIVCDHHTGEAAMPSCFALINPNRIDETSPHRQLAAVGVAFLLAIAINRQLRRDDFYSLLRPEPDLLGVLDLVALGTVCDVALLTGVNRALVAQGLRVLGQPNKPGFIALMAQSSRLEPANADYLGYQLGPKINAGGRVGRADYGARLLMTDDPEEAAMLALELECFNQERRALEAAMTAEAIAAVERQGGTSALILVTSTAWHPGVIGIVAARLKDRFHRPAIVAAIDAGGVVKASGRSIRGIHLGEAIIAARQAGLVQSGGGHAMAAGFTASADKLAELTDFLEARVKMRLPEQPVTPSLTIDAALDVGAADLTLIEDLTQLAPFGAGNPEPRFVLPRARIGFAAPVGDGHLQLNISGSQGGALKAIAFRAGSNGLSAALTNNMQSLWHFAGTIRGDSWQGKTRVQFCLEDAAAVVD